MTADPEFDATAMLETALRHHQAGRSAEAERMYRQALAAEPDNSDALHLLGILRHQAGRSQEAIELIERAVRHGEPNEQFLNNLGQIYKAVGRYADAVACYRKAIAANPALVEAYCNLGNALSALGDDDGAAAAYQDAMRIRPGYPLALYNLGTVRLIQGKFAEAADLFRQCLARNPNNADAHNNLGLALLEQGYTGEAVECFERALAFRPTNPDCLNNLGRAFVVRDQRDRALQCFERALAAHPDHAGALNNQANLYRDLGRLEEAIAGYRRALHVNPGNNLAASNLLFALAAACAWPEHAQWAEDMDRRLRDTIGRQLEPAELPFHNVARCPDPNLNFAVARLWSMRRRRSLAGAAAAFAFQDRRCAKPKLVIGYLSRDFRNHPVGHLVYNLFRHHDRNRFVVHAYSYGADDGSCYRQRVVADCDQFSDLRTSSDDDAARRIYDDKVDILVDLTGLTQNGRLGICALRPAPVQVSYLGFPGTTGADFMDYIVTDRIVTPPEHLPYYSETPVYMPRCYQVNAGVPTNLEQRRPTRTDAGLPHDRFVFCSFCQPYKIDATVFDVWMKILAALPASVLWLYKANSPAERNLRAAAAARGVDPHRLVFAGHCPREQHLARLGLADLGLDTFVYGGHTTTTDMLIAGVPVLTLAGSHFASRVSTSILSAAGLPELAAATRADYKALALTLAHDRDRLTELRARLRHSHRTAPFFDTARFARALERAYEEMWHVFEKGRKPRPITVTEAD